MFPEGMFQTPKRELRYIELSGNSFHGAIPSNIGTGSPNLNSLNLNFNSFSGNIPSSLVLSSLTSFKLDHNRLTGRLGYALALLSFPRRS